MSCEYLYNNKWYSKVELKNVYNQITNKSQLVSSIQTLEKVRLFLKRIGVEERTVYKIVDEQGNVIDANGRANLLRGLIEVVNGKQDVALTEEAMHFAVNIVEQTNPALFNSMLSSVGNYDLYKSIINDNSPGSYRQLYQKDGKPDIRKIKKEVMGKLLAEAVIENIEGNISDLRGQTLTWWEHIKQWLRQLFSRTNINPFDTAAEHVLSGKMEGKVELRDETYLQTSSNKQSSINDKIKVTQNEVTKEYKKDTDTTNSLSDDSDVNNWYVYNGKRVANRVTDKVKSWYRRKFGDKEFTKSAIAYNEIKRETGVLGHLDFESITRLFVDEQTNILRDIPLPKQESAIGNQAAYDKIYQYLSDLFAQHEKGTKFYPEAVIYDKTADQAGTIDLLAVSPSGITSVYDWKFMVISGNQTDVPWFKQNAFELQIREYRKILKEQYSVTEFGQTRAIPIVMEMSPDLFLNGRMSLDGISVGSADPRNITDLKLIPVPVDEKTGIKELDKKIAKLNALYKRESNRTVEEGKRDVKADRLNTIKTAIRLLQTQTNLHVFVEAMAVNAGDMQTIIDKYNNQIKNSDINSFSNVELSEFAENILDQLSTAELYEDVDRIFASRIADMDEEQAKELTEALSGSSTSIRIKRDRLRNISKEFADKYIGQRNGITGLLTPQKVVRGLLSKFSGMSKLGLKSLDLLYKVAADAQDRARMDGLKENEHIIELRKEVLSYAESKGIKKTDIFSGLFKKYHKGERVHLLIDEISQIFYKTLDEKAEKADSQWFKDNINLESYRIEAAEYIARRKEQIENTTYPGDIQQQANREAADILKLTETYDIYSPHFTGWDNYIMKRNIKDRAKWYTPEYKAIVGTPLEKLYQYHQKINKFAASIGYIDASRQRTFTPFLRKTLVDKMFWGGNISPVQDFINDLALADDPNKYGTVDENGEIIPSIPKFYTSDIGKKTDEIDEKTKKEKVDYSDVSEDLFKNLIAFNTQVYKYKYLSEIEGQIELVKTIEEFKGHLDTTRTGKVRRDNDTNELIILGEGESGGNPENTKLLDDYIKTVLYGQKYSQSTADAALPISGVVNSIKKMVNKVAGKEVFSTEDKPTPTSMIKTIDALNRTRRMQVLGLNVLSGAATLFGNNIQVAAQSGEYFNYRNFLDNERKLVTHKLTFQEQSLLPSLLNTFLPMNEDVSSELFKEAGVKKLTNHSLSDWLMILMRKPDELLEKAVFMSLLDNMMVGEDGKFVNINKYVKDKYPNRYSSPKEFNETSGKIQKEITQLRNTKSINKTASVVDGKLSIPGFDLNDRTEIIRLAQLSKNLTRNANGNVTDLDRTQMQMNVFTNSMMVFKNWIPGLVSTRFAGITRTADNFEGVRYDIGRIRLFFKLMTQSISDKSLNILNILQVNQKGIEKMDELFLSYAKAYEEKTGEPFEMDRNEFFDLIRNNTRNAVKELTILISLLAAMFALGALKPDDDKDKRSKNLYKLAYRTFDKMKDELTFFYNPINLEQVLQGSIFPSLGIFTDAARFTKSIAVEIGGDDEDNKHNHPLKYLAKLFPVSNSWLLYVSALDPEIGKSLEVSIPTTNQMR